MLEIIMIMILIRTDETQISFRPGQLSLFEKNTKNFLFSPLPPHPSPLVHPRSTSKWTVLHSFYSFYMHPSYLLLNSPCYLGYCSVDMRTEVIGNRGQSSLQSLSTKLTTVQLHKRADGKDLPCSLLPAVRVCSNVRAVSQAVPGLVNS